MKVELNHIKEAFSQAEQGVGAPGRTGELMKGLDFDFFSTPSTSCEARWTLPIAPFCMAWRSLSSRSLNFFFSK